ncbi:MAG: transposase [Magnetococcales bacterium]|nr:transposase [Magnetococcales bacterium]
MCHDVTDDLWEQIEPLLEPFKRKRSKDNKPVPFRNIFNGILFLLRTGCQWRFPICLTICRRCVTSASSETAKTTKKGGLDTKCGVERRAGGGR